MSRPELSFLVPAFNEEPNIEATLATVGEVMARIGLPDYEVVVVDDGSADATARLVQAAAARDPRVRLVRHETNRGLGAAIRSGIAALGAEKFMVVPGDNDVKGSFIEVMARHRDAADLVIAAPLNLEIRPYGRIILSLTYRLLYYIAFQVYVFYINAPCVWPTALVRSVEATSERFSIVSEINVKLLRSGVRFAEVPGYLSGGRPGGAASWRNLREVAAVFLRLNWEIHVSRRAQFARRPERVYIDLGRLGSGPASAQEGAGGATELTD